MKCIDKKQFQTHEEAQKRLNKIGVNYRIYKCSECNLFHFTKMSKNEHKFRTDSKFREGVIRQNFIRRESEYWSKRFGLEYE